MANYRPQHLFPFDQAQNMGLWYFSHSIYQIYETEKQNHRKACQDFEFFLFLPHPAKLAQLKDPSFKSFFSTLLWVWDQRPKIPFSNLSQIYLCFTKLYTVLYRLRKRYCVLIVLPLKQLNSRQLIISNNEHFPRKSPFLWNSITWWTFKNLLEKKISPIGLLNRRQLNSFQFYFGEHQRCCTEHNKR